MFKLPTLFILLSFFLLFEPVSWAAMPEKDYRAALELAEQKVVRKNNLKTLKHTAALARARSLRSNPSSTNTVGTMAPALSAPQPLLKELLNRTYKVGDQWDVAVWQLFQDMSKVTDDENKLSLSVIHFGIFHYEVTDMQNDVQTDMQNGNSPILTLKVTQTTSPLNADVKTHSLSGADVQTKHLIDRNVTSLQLKMTEELEQIEKKYILHQNTEMRVSPEGIRSAMTPLELMPLDIPEIFSAKQKILTTLPPLPPPVADFAKKIHFNPNLSQSIYFQQDDFFGRPIDILWQKGEPWPSYLKTPNGIALLLKKEST